MRLLVIFLLTAFSTVQALDLTPVEVKATGEGGTYVYLKFKNGKKDMTYMPPKKWEYWGGTKFSLLPPNVIGAEIDFTTQELNVPLAVEEASLKAFEEMAVKSLPQGATNVEIVASAFNPMEIDGLKTIEVKLKYGFYGQVLRSSYIYVTREKTLLRCSVAARPADFDALHKTFVASLHTLAGL